jgi:transcriptional regulator with XRE-family HTH domain
MPVIKSAVSRKTPNTAADQARGARIREAINDSGLAQAEVARRVGIGATALWSLCEGRSTPRGETLDALAEVLGVSQAWMLFGTQPKKRGRNSSGVYQASPDLMPRGPRHRLLERWLTSTPWGQRTTGEEREWLDGIKWPDEIPEETADDAFLYALLSYRATKRAKSGK